MAKIDLDKLIAQVYASTKDETPRQRTGDDYKLPEHMAEFDTEAMRRKARALFALRQIGWKPPRPPMTPRKRSPGNKNDPMVRARSAWDRMLSERNDLPFEDWSLTADDAIKLLARVSVESLPSIEYTTARGKVVSELDPKATHVVGTIGKERGEVTVRISSSHIVFRSKGHGQQTWTDFDRTLAFVRRWAR